MSRTQPGVCVDGYGPYMCSATIVGAGENPGTRTCAVTNPNPKS